ncbi:DUF2169 domain-containing protein [Polyangium sp. 6x1]|uniref:DUF2169 family type VI secretion system accessory protein n=1 Tax=Polyangium sp. 6x1 TaxID=3042689 RepID=UPI00248307F1|nr:DUF2169 domain-containing protein [Polyangium sp. 6x1]MDI1446429.1 DUF2169 domain-containing protein [Polyangium sp. 6x1]
MEIRSFCPFPAAAFVWEAAPGVHSLTILVKATFLLVHGAEATVAPAQDEPSGDVTWDNEPGASLRFATDFAPLKPRTDVLVVGHAFAPKGAPVKELSCRVEMGDFAKGLNLVGDRRFTPGPEGLSAGPPAVFTRMPLRYERAARGEGNPVGIDLAAPPSPGARAMANVTVSTGQTPGLGPLAPGWPQRRRLVTDEGHRWATATRGEESGPAPEGFDFGFFQAAPSDQQIPLLRPGATLVLEHLHPTLERVETRLPAARPQAFRIDPKTGRVSEIALRCDTLTIDTDRSRLSLVFRGLTDVPAKAPIAVGTLVVASHPQGLRVRPADIEKVVKQGGSLEDVAGAPEKHPLEMRHDTRPIGQVRSGGTTSGSASAKAPALPFRPTAPGAPASAAPEAPAAPPRPALPFGSGTVHVGAPAVVIRPATPFERTSVPPPPPAPVPAKPEEELDIEPDPPTPARPSAPPPSARVLPFGSVTLGPSSGVPKVSPATPFQATAPRQHPEGPPRVLPNAGLPFVPAEAAPPSSPAPASVPASVPAPALVPAPAPESASAVPIPFSPKDAVKPALVTLPTIPLEPKPPEPEQGEPALPGSALLLPLPLEKYASIAAEIAGPTVDVGVTLRRHGLDEEKWAGIEAESTAIIAEDAVRAEGALLEAFDRIYVARMEALGRKVDVQGHARLSVAAAHGKLSRCLEELGLGRADLLPLRRSIGRRTAKDPAFATELRAATEAERVASPPPEVGLFKPPRRRARPS